MDFSSRIDITFEMSLSFMVQQPSWASLAFALIHDLTGFALHDYRDVRNDAIEASLRIFDQCISDISWSNTHTTDSTNHLHHTVSALAFTINNHFEDGFLSLETFLEADLYLSDVKALVWDMETRLHALREHTDALKRLRLRSSLMNRAEFLQALLRGSEALWMHLLGE